MTDCCPATPEVCHNEPCDGIDEVAALLPTGRIWSIGRGGVYAGWMKALGCINLEMSTAICQEWAEVDPCTSSRLLPYWISVYSMPPCVDQTADNLCAWIDLITDPDCPVGSVGFYQRAIDFVLPAAGVTVEFADPSFEGVCSQIDSTCLEENFIQITAPPEVFYFEESIRDFPMDPQDPNNPCRCYFIPEIECLRYGVFPIGLSLGYQTDPRGPDNEQIFGVPDTNTQNKPQLFTSNCTLDC